MTTVSNELEQLRARRLEIIALANAELNVGKWANYLKELEDVEEKLKKAGDEIPEWED